MWIALSFATPHGFVVYSGENLTEYELYIMPRRRRLLRLILVMAAAVVVVTWLHTRHVLFPTPTGNYFGDQLAQRIQGIPHRELTSLFQAGNHNERLSSNLNCREREAKDIRLTPRDVPFTALASVWRSGNTWVRHLVQQATGYGTSAIYCDKDILEAGYPFECEQTNRKRIMLVKVHQPDPKFERTYVDRPPENILPFDRAVFLIRNPYEFIVANIYYKHLEVVPEEDFLKPKSRWRYGQPKLFEWWNDMNEYWLRNFSGPVYPLLYSRLRANVKGELRRLLGFIDVDVTDADVTCAVRNGEGHFHRPRRKWSKISSIVELFDSSLQSKINSSVAEFRKHLKLKYSIDWNEDIDDLLVNEPKT
ncbi:WSCD family member AAEL009094-like [Dreissena polymorpha]|uniref:Sulfotransferase domain-containing protein n=1 Tax=Dreissena polymorpha TaxID=45954 RepID=A0A9D4NF63_DREPO|nr:WSCD family member AAEL009094-like [Dreissena polymorpha]KAH3893201.1 hypothetical protein DPMN_017345 [Dreissena polymorpha]